MRKTQITDYRFLYTCSPLSSSTRIIAPPYILIYRLDEDIKDPSARHHAKRGYPQFNRMTPLSRKTTVYNLLRDGGVFDSNWPTTKSISVELRIRKVYVNESPTNIQYVQS
jgi:hypothetical protein